MLFIQAIYWSSTNLSTTSALPSIDELLTKSRAYFSNLGKTFYGDAELEFAEWKSNGTTCFFTFSLLLQVITSRVTEHVVVIYWLVSKLLSLWPSDGLKEKKKIYFHQTTA